MRGVLTGEDTANPWARRIGIGEAAGYSLGELRHSSFRSTGYERQPISNQEGQTNHASQKTSDQVRQTIESWGKTEGKPAEGEGKESRVMGKFSPSIRGTLLEKYIRDSKNDAPPLDKPLSESKPLAATGLRRGSVGLQPSAEQLHSRTTPEESSRAAKDTLRTSREDFTDVALMPGSTPGCVTGSLKGPLDTLRSGDHRTAAFEAPDSRRDNSSLDTGRCSQFADRMPLSDRSNQMNQRFDELAIKSMPKSSQLPESQVQGPLAKQSAASMASVLREQANFDKENASPVRSFIKSALPKETPLKQTESGPQLQVHPSGPQAEVYPGHTFREAAPPVALNPHSPDKGSVLQDIPAADTSQMTVRECQVLTKAVKDIMKSSIQLRDFDQERTQNDSLLRASMQNLQQIREYQRKIAKVKPNTQLQNMNLPDPVLDTKSRYTNQSYNSFAKSSAAASISQFARAHDGFVRQSSGIIANEQLDQSRVSGIPSRSKSPISIWAPEADHSDIPSFIGMFGQSKSRPSLSPVNGKLSQINSSNQNPATFRYANTGSCGFMPSPMRDSRPEAEANQFGKGFFSFKETPEEVSRREAGGFTPTDWENSNISRLFDGTTKSQRLSPISKNMPLKAMGRYSPRLAKQGLVEAHDASPSRIILEEDVQPLDSARERFGSKHSSKANWQANHSGIGYDELELTLKFHNKEDLTIKSSTTAVLQF